jgi:geranylgeranyl diphosphate synthase type II
MSESPESFDLNGYLAPRRARVEVLLKEHLEAMAGRMPPQLLDAMRYSLMAGGKRLRPVLCLSFAEVIRQPEPVGTVAEDAACALEMVHTYSLVHDDLPSMDNDDLRRGIPTNHKVFGESTATLAGDALNTDAFTVLTLGDEPSRLLLCRELATAAGAMGMVGGQVLDLAPDRPAEEGYLLRLHRGKTGALIRAACRMGVIAAGGSQAQLEAATTYGEAVGLAFQIADDILDVESDPSQLGKPTGADAAAGRHTFPAVVGMKRSKQMARELVERASSAVETLEGKNGPLAALARYSVERKS